MKHERTVRDLASQVAAVEALATTHPSVLAVHIAFREAMAAGASIPSLIAAGLVCAVCAVEESREPQTSGLAAITTLVKMLREAGVIPDVP